MTKVWPSKCLCCRGVSGKRNAASVASIFVRFKSGWLQRVDHTARKCIQNTHHWSRRPQTSHQNQPSGPSWITPSLLQLCVSGVVVFQLVPERAVVIASTAFNSDIVFCDNCGFWGLHLLVESNSCYPGLIFLQLSVMTLCALIHDDRLIHQIK